MQYKTVLSAFTAHNELGNIFKIQLLQLQEIEREEYDMPIPWLIAAGALTAGELIASVTAGATVGAVVMGAAKALDSNKKTQSKNSTQINTKKDDIQRLIDETTETAKTDLQRLTDEITQIQKFNAQWRVDRELHKVMDEELEKTEAFMNDIKKELDNFDAMRNKNKDSVETLTNQVDDFIKNQWLPQGSVLPTILEKMKRKLAMQESLVQYMQIDFVQGQKKIEQQRAAEALKTKKYQEVQGVINRVEIVEKCLKNFEKAWLLDKTELTLKDFEITQKRRNAFENEYTRHKMTLNTLKDNLLSVEQSVFELVEQDTSFRILLQQELENGKKRVEELEAELPQLKEKYDALCLEYDTVNETFLAAWNLYAEEIEPAIKALTERFEACRKLEQQNIWKNYDDEIADEAEKMIEEYEKIQKSIEDQCVAPLVTLKKCKFVDTKIWKERQQIILDQQKSDLLDEIKSLHERHDVPEEDSEKYYQEPGKEIVYLEYVDDVEKTLLKYNGEDILEDQIQNRPFSEWFVEDQNWAGLPLELAEEINDDFELRFRGSKEEYDQVKTAMEAANLEDIHCEITWIRKKMRGGANNE